MMKNLVIANKGTSNTGKSTAIKFVYELLKKRGITLLSEEFQGGDIKAIFEIDGVKVGIESQGDPGYEMEPTMEQFVAENCAIIITACRTKSTTYKKVRDYLGKQKGYDILWLAHYVYNGSNESVIRARLNSSYAEYVVWLIEERIMDAL